MPPYQYCTVTSVEYVQYSYYLLVHTFSSPLPPSCIQVPSPLSPPLPLKVVPVPEDQLPVRLPDNVKFTGRGPSPLLQDTQWLTSGTCGK